MKKYITLIALAILFTCHNAFASPQLSSLPGAKATIFLDFDGHYVTTTVWNSGEPLACAPAGMNDAQLIEIFNRVAEDYRPFEVNVTTDSAVFLLAPLTKRIRIIVTTTSAWYPGVGGVAFLGSFTWGDDTPVFVFTNRLGPFNAKIVAECCSHESGHSVGLSHQSKYDGACALTATYNDGMGSGETSWAPIMGNSYYKNKTGWNNGPTPGGCNYLQDNLTIITSRNGFNYRPDDHSNDPEISSSQIVIDNKPFSTGGIITTAGDRDVFMIDLKTPGSLHVNAFPFSVGANDNGANLDIKITLLNELMQIINVYDPGDLLNVAFDTILTPGTYYMVLDGTGNRFSTDYGSLGSYTVSGTFTPLTVTPVSNIVLGGKVDGNKHYLYWKATADKQIKSGYIESSTDGRYFKSLSAVTTGTGKFTYAVIESEQLFYRLKLISAEDKTQFSNVIALKSPLIFQKSFAISTMNNNEIVMVSAKKSYKYIVSDINGRIIAQGTNPAGSQKIDIDKHRKGLYIISLINEKEKVTERILRL